MKESVLLSTAYFPPASYFSLIAGSVQAYIETQENYKKQTYRNRCIILGANGPLALTVPVLRGSFHKTPIKDIILDDSRRWKGMHLQSIVSAYSNSPYFEYYIDIIKDVFNRELRYLLDLNLYALETINKAVHLETEICMTDSYIHPGKAVNDYRYTIIPKKQPDNELQNYTPYMQVFSDRFGFIPDLSILDMLFNNGPGTKALLLRSPE